MRQFGVGALLVAIVCCPTPGGEIVMREVLAISGVASSGRSPVRVDAVERLLVEGSWTAPQAGDTVTLPGGRGQAWTLVAAADNGEIPARALARGYALWVFESDAQRVMSLEASGHGMVYVNGEPRAGDPYGNGWLRLPILIRRGRNELLFASGRGSIRAKLTEIAGPSEILPADLTIPDLVAQPPVEAWVGLVVANNRLVRSTVEVLSTTADDETRTSITIAPLSIRKAAIPVRFLTTTDLGRLLVRTVDGPPERCAIDLRVRRPLETRRVTFRSAIDGSVQYYALRPATGGPEDDPAIILALHGASVEALGHVDSMSSKPWAHIVSPTNRRPFGFDWEDWGRIDAMEVLDEVQRVVPANPSRIYLAGHSMGGHGAWHLGVLYPGRFAAIGPSAGWISFWSYAGGATFDDSPIGLTLHRAAGASDTLALSRNLLYEGVYILHGDADDNVPVDQARQIRDCLAEFHRDTMYHEQAGAGHWWDDSDQPGTGCTDWTPMWDMFTRRRIPSMHEVRRVEFVTPNPGVSASCHWVTIESQERWLEPSSVDIRFDPGLDRFVGTTANVDRLALAAGVPTTRKSRIELDGIPIDDAPFEQGLVTLTKSDGRWSVTAAAPRSQKGPHRCGPFKEAFRNQMVLVYGTAGSPEENDWSLAKARFDAETWYYRGNGSVDVVPDRELIAAAEDEPDRNVILYGNAQSNAAWGQVLGSNPAIWIDRRGVTIGDRVEAGDDLACLCILPRAGSDIASVGIVSGTGLKGLRLTNRVPTFVSGVALPDWTIWRTSALTEGLAGYVGTGFFDGSWGFDPAQSAWRE